MPATFDVPLAEHHKLVGRWAAAQVAGNACTRAAARRLVERTFEAAVLEVLGPCELADFGVTVLAGDADLPPAIAVVCNSIGQIDLGWIEKSNVLANTLTSTVAPVGWQATAYKALSDTLRGTLPIFGYEDLFEELSGYYWDGETDDEGARQALIQWHGHDPADLSEMTLPSQMNERRPPWMLAENTQPLKQLPPGLCRRLRRLRSAHAAVKDLEAESNAWHFDFNVIVDYIPEFEDCSHLPPLTLVPFDHFARELDDVANHGIEIGFMDVAGLCQLKDADSVDGWFASLRLGVEVLLAAQDLIDFDPARAWERS